MINDDVADDNPPMLMDNLHIKLFGAMEVQHGQHPPQQPTTQKVLSFLGYLIMQHGIPQPREKLVSLCWPDLTPRQSRRKLSDTLWRTRRLLTAPDAHTTPLLILTGDTITFHTTSRIWVDVIHFEQLTHAIEQEDAHNDALNAQLQPHLVEQLQAVISLYRGDLLEECYDDWAILERERLHERYLGLLERLLAHYQAIGAHAMALQTAQRLAHAAPLREDVHLTLMQIYDELGRDSEAIHVYEQLRTLLAHELHIAPDQATTNLYDAIVMRRQLRRHEGIHNVIDTATPENEQIDAADQLLVSASTTPDRQAKIIALTAAAEAWLQRGDLEQAFQLIIEALQVGRQAGVYPLLGRVLRVLSLTRAADRNNRLPTSDDIPTAEEGFRASVALLETTHYDSELSVTLACYGAWLLAHGRVAEATTILQRARTLLQTYEMHAELAQVQLLLQQSQLTSAPRANTRQVRLARLGTPRGRPVKREDLVEVTWTLDAETDIQTFRTSGKIALRRQRLCRLCAEAHTQGAEPTLHDLAEALGTTPRTVSRDLAALRAAGQIVQPHGLITRRQDGNSISHHPDRRSPSASSCLYFPTQCSFLITRCSLSGDYCPLWPQPISFNGNLTNCLPGLADHDK